MANWITTNIVVNTNTVEEATLLYSTLDKLTDNTNRIPLLAVAKHLNSSTEYGTRGYILAPQKPTDKKLFLSMETANEVLITLLVELVQKTLVNFDINKIEYYADYLNISNIYGGKCAEVYFTEEEFSDTNYNKLLENTLKITENNWVSDVNTILGTDYTESEISEMYEFEFFENVDIDELVY